MADPTTPNTPPTPEPNTVTVKLPEGMSQEQLLKSFASFQKTQVYTKKYDKAVRDALSALRKVHEPEYQTLLAAQMKVQGIAKK